MSNKYNFGRDAFRVWLRKNENQKFKRCSGGSCPLAVFAKKGCGFKRVSVGPDAILINGKEFDTKAWQTHFINSVDEPGYGRISGKEAFRILNRYGRGRSY